MSSRERRLPRAVKAPDALVQATIEKMHEKNDELKRQSARQASDEVPRYGFRLARALAPIAACLVVALGFGIYLNRPVAGMEFTPFSLSALPEMAVGGRSAADLPSIDDFEERLGIDFGALIPGYKVTGVRVDWLISSGMEGELLATVTYANGNDSLVLVAASVEPIVMRALKVGSPTSIGAQQQVYLGRDEAGGELFACWQSGNGYYCLSSSSIGQDPFVSLLHEMWKVG